MVREALIEDAAPIGVIAAMDEELAKYLEVITELRTEKVLDATFNIGKIHGKPVVAVKCGIGKVNAAMVATAMILRYSPRAIINTGIAGGVGIDTLSAVIGASAVQYDFDTTAFGDPLGLVDGFDSVYIPADENLCDVFRTVLPKCYCGVIASADRFVQDTQTLNTLKNSFAALACDFETAAIYQVAKRSKVPAVSIRVISDGNGNHSVCDYLTFKTKASGMAADAVMSAIQKL